MPHSSATVGLMKWMFLDTLADSGEKLWHHLQTSDGWRPGLEGTDWQGTS